MSENMGVSTSRNPKGLHGLYRDVYLYLRVPENTVGRIISGPRRRVEKTA
jgi:hypothetical protein